jgi:hypothetical protein
MTWGRGVNPFPAIWKGTGEVSASPAPYESSFEPRTTTDGFAGDYSGSPECTARAPCEARR